MALLCPPIYIFLKLKLLFSLCNWDKRIIGWDYVDNMDFSFHGYIFLKLKQLFSLSNWEKRIIGWDYVDNMAFLLWAEKGLNCPQPSNTLTHEVNKQRRGYTVKNYKNVKNDNFTVIFSKAALMHSPRRSSKGHVKSWGKKTFKKN